MPVSKKRKFVKDGLFFAEINEFLRRVLYEDGYAGVEIKPKPDTTHVIIQCTKIPEVVRRIPYIQKLIQLRHKFKNEESLRVYAEKVQARGLSARAQAQSICYKLKGGLAVRRACYGVLKFIMDDGNAKGVEIIISGKLRGARAKAMKFNEGYMVTSGDATKYYIVEAVEHVLLRQGTIGVRVKIMLPYDPEGRKGCSKQLPDIVVVKEPQPEKNDDDEEEVQPYGQAPPQEQFPPVADGQTPFGGPQGPPRGQYDQAPPPQQQPQQPSGYDQGGQGQFYQQPPPNQNYGVTPGGPESQF
jgi:small subunit ribosomal protein S3e